MLFRRSPCAVALAMGALIHCPWALADAPASAESLELVKVEDQASPFRQVYGVEVTGTAIINPKARERLPLTVIERRDIERSGATALPALLEQLSIVGSSPNAGEFGAAFSGPLSVGLRGEFKSTLVLLNGLRLPAYGIQSPQKPFEAPDLKFLPLSLIERIEILREGASTLYGSDAVAGVINIITRNDIQGPRMHVESDLVQGGGGNRGSIDLQWGKGRLAADGYQWLVAMGQAKDSPLGVSERPTVWLPRTRIGLSAAGYVWPGNIYDPQRAAFLPHPFYANGQCDGEHYYAGEELGRRAGVCYFDETSLLHIYPEQTRSHLFVQGQLALGGGHTLGLEHTVGRSVARAPAFMPTFVYQDPSTGRYHYLSSFAAGMSGVGYADQFRRSSATLQGTLHDLRYKASLFDGQQTALRRFLDIYDSPPSGYLSTAELYTPPELWSEETLRKLQALRKSSDSELGRSRTYGAQLLVSGDRELSNGLLAQYAVGLGWRGEEQQLTQFTVGQEDKARRSATHALAEVAWPVNEKLSVGLGGRTERYSDVGQANALKFSAKYQPNTAWLLRGAIGNGFRAPSLAMTELNLVSQGVLTDTSYTNGRQVRVFYGANPELKPERSRHITLGAVWNTGANWAASVDWWALHSNGLIYVPASGVVLADPTLRARYVRELPADTPNPTNALGMYLNPENLGVRQQQGIDYQFSHRRPAAGGVLRLQWGGTFNIQSDFQERASSQKLTDLGNYLSQTGRYTPRHKWSVVAAFDPQAGQRHQLTLRYLSGNVELDGSDQRAVIPSHWSLDWYSRWQVNRQISLGVGIQNITDRLPPMRNVSRGLAPGFDTRYGDFRGRTLTLQLDAKL